MTPTRAMILAAGLGTRMRPLTDTLPKPLVEVAGRPLIDHAIDFFVRRGVTELVVNLSYKAELLLPHLQNRRDVKIVISPEPQPLETGGGIARALPHFNGEAFFCLNSDNIVVDPAGEVLHRLASAAGEETKAVLLLHPTDRATGYDGAGDFRRTPAGRLQRRRELAAAPYVFAGLQWLHPRFFISAPAGKFSMNLLYDLGISPEGVLDEGIRSVLHAGDWLHVGDPAGLELAERYFL